MRWELDILASEARGKFTMIRKLLIAIAALFAPVTANALPVTFEYIATASAFNATVVGTFGFDSAAVDTNANQDIGVYAGGFLTASVTGGPQDGGSLSLSNLVVARSVPTQTLQIQEQLFSGSGIGIGGFSGGDALPDSAAVLAAFAAAPTQQFVSFTDADFGIMLPFGQAYKVISISAVQPVPLPAGGVLLLSALAGFGLLARRRRATHGTAV